MQSSENKNKGSGKIIKYDIEKEYEDFIYTVSHDFQAPVRHIKNFAKFLIEARGEPNKEEKEYISYIEDATLKLQKMQEALLTLSRIKTEPKNWIDQDCNEVVSYILKTQTDITDIKYYDIDVRQLPILNVDECFFKLALQHLIENALKFHEHKSDNKKIKISASFEDNQWVFTIEDNGIGIQERYKDDVFQIFRRIHPEDYNGIGAGLTIARKIIRLHGGEIWLDTDYDRQGTAIKFSI